MVRAKFKVGIVSHLEHGGEVVLEAVTCGSEENKKFWKYTPAGHLKMHIDNPEAMAQFKPGQEFYLDLTPAPIGD